MSGSSTQLLRGQRPRTAVRTLAVAVALAGIALVVRAVAPSLLLGGGSSFLAAVAGFLLAVGVGYHGESVLVGMLVAALPVFGVAAASTAMSEPATLGLAVRAATRAAWYTLGVGVLFAGPSGYAIGTLLPRLRDGGDGRFAISRSVARGHLTIARDHRRPLLAWGLVAAGIVVLWPAVPTSLALSSVAGSPAPVAGGLAVAALLGYRAPGALASVLAAGIGLSAGLLLFTNGLVLQGSGTGARAAARLAVTLVLVGFAAGVPYGLVGYVVGRSLDR